MSTKGIDKKNIIDYDFEYSDINVTDVTDVTSNNSLSKKERKILADLLYFDTQNDSDDSNGSALYDRSYQGYSSQDSNLAIQLQYVSDDDISNYVESNLGLSGSNSSKAIEKIKTVFNEARSLSQESFKNPLLKKSNVIQFINGFDYYSTDLHKDGFAEALEKSVRAFIPINDSSDGIIESLEIQYGYVINPSRVDDFAKFYNLTTLQKNTLQKAIMRALET